MENFILNKRVKCLLFQFWVFRFIERTSVLYLFVVTDFNLRSMSDTRKYSPLFFPFFTSFFVLFIPFLWFLHKILHDMDKPFIRFNIPYSLHFIPKEEIKVRVPLREEKKGFGYRRCERSGSRGSRSRCLVPSRHGRVLRNFRASDTVYLIQNSFRVGGKFAVDEESQRGIYRRRDG